MSGPKPRPPQEPVSDYEPEEPGSDHGPIRRRCGANAALKAAVKTRNKCVSASVITDGGRLLTHCAGGRPIWWYSFTHPWTKDRIGLRRYGYERYRHTA